MMKNSRKHNIPYITVLTPSYNRGYCLSFLYNSLKQQSSIDFEWIIVDDGSTDNTEGLVQQWLTDHNQFQMSYRKKNNGGKHTAINLGVKFAKGQFVFIVDSDDTLTKDAIEKVIEWCQEIDNQMDFIGVSGCRGHKDGTRIGDFPYSKEYIDATNIERYRYKLMGDKAEIYRTRVLQEHPFPVYPGERFLGEGAVWDELAHQGYKLRWHRDIIYLCEYQEDGLTKNYIEHVRSSFQGFSLVKKNAYKYYPFPYNWQSLISYVSTSRLCCKSKHEIMTAMNIGTAEYIIALFLGKLKHVYKSLKKW